MMSRLKARLLKACVLGLPVIALAAALPSALLAPAKTQPEWTSSPSAERSITVARAIAPANQQAAETAFDAFLQASTNGLPSSSSKGNALSAMYAAIGQQVDGSQAIALNANNSRDLLNKMSTRDSNSALSGGWNLNLSTSNFDGISLSRLSFLQYFPNLTGVSLVTLAASVSPNPAAFVINSLADIGWLSGLKNLRTLRIVNDPAKSPSQFSSAGLSILQDLPLDSADFTRFMSVASATAAPRSIFATLDLNADWYRTMRYGFKILMPPAFTIAANNALYTVQTGDGTAKEIVKAIAPALANPTPAYRSISLDGGRYDAVLADSKLIWPLNATTISSIAFTDAAGNYFTTSGADRQPVSRRTLSAAEIALFNRYAAESVRKAIDVYSIIRPETVTTANAAQARAYIEKKVVVDGVPVPRVMVSGSLYWAFDQTKARFRNDTLTKFWTSYERISAEDLANEKDKVQTISESVYSAQQDRSTAFYVRSIDPPTSEAQTFFVNNTPIAALRDLRSTSGAKYFWDFTRQGFLPGQIKFYSKSTFRAFTSVTELLAEKDRAQGFNYATYSSAEIASFDALPVDNDPADLPSDIFGGDAIAAYLAKNTEARVSIDGQLYGYVLRNGRLFVDADTSLINFVVVSGTTRLYYTSFSKIPATQVSSAKLLPKIAPRTIPNQKAIVTPNLATLTSTININGAETLQYGINNGKLYWRFAGSTVSGLSKLRYVDTNGIYYTLGLFELSAQVIVSGAMTEVVPTPDDTNASTSGFVTSVLLSQQLDRTNYFVIDLYDSIQIDNNKSKTYTRRIAHSMVYWLDANNAPLTYFGDISLQEFESQDGKLVEAPFFYTSNQNAQNNSKSFPEKVRQINPPLATLPVADLAPVEIKDPTAPDQTMKVYTNGVLVVLQARQYTDEGTPYIWSDKAIAEKIRYAAKQPDGTFVYFTELSDQVWQTPGVATDDITEAKVSVAQAVVTRDALFQDNVYEIEAVKYALIGVFSSLFVAGAALFIWRVFRKRVQNV